MPPTSGEVADGLDLGNGASLMMPATLPDVDP